MSAPKNPNVVLVESKWPVAAMFLGSLLMILASLWLIRFKGEVEFPAFLAVLLFGSCAVIFAIALLPNARVWQLEKEGFVLLFFKVRTPLVRWSEVQGFYPGTKLVGSLVFFDLVEASRSKSILARIAYALFCHHGLLPPIRKMSAGQLASLMNRFLEDSRKSELPPTVL